MSQRDDGRLICMRFTTTLLLHGKTATGVEVPPAVVEALGAGKRPAVRVTLGTHTYRSTVAPMGGRFLLPVSAEHRAAAGVQAGDSVDVHLEVDDAPRKVEVPAELAAALAAVPGARDRFDALSYSRRQRLVLPVAQAKTQETRDRRVAKALEELA